MAITQTNPSELLRQVRTILREPLTLTDEQKTAIQNAQTAFLTAREQVEIAARARKDKAAKVSQADALFEVTRERYALAQDIESNAERERYLRALAVGEQMYAAIAEEAFRLNHRGPMKYVNSVPTGEKVKDYYGEREVWRTTSDDEPVPNRVRAFEVGDFRITIKSDLPRDLRFEVSALSDEVTQHGTARIDRFGYHADVSADRNDKNGMTVKVAWGTVGARTLEDAETVMTVYQLAIRLGHIVQRVVDEARR